MNKTRKTIADKVITDRHHGYDEMHCNKKTESSSKLGYIAMFTLVLEPLKEIL